jgi:hypothetical protein
VQLKDESGKRRVRLSYFPFLVEKLFSASFRKGGNHYSFHAVTGESGITAKKQVVRHENLGLRFGSEM